MNCRQTRDLISAYLDQELTGQQMLEVREHLNTCEECAAEYRGIRDVRRFLRSGLLYSPPAAAQQRLESRLDREAAGGPGLIPQTLDLWDWLPSFHWGGEDMQEGPRPRGRRLASALALSSVVVLAVAAPLFAPSTEDGGARTTAQPATQAGMFGGPWLSLPSLGGGGLLPSMRLAAPPTPVSSLSEASYVQEYRPAEQNTDDDPMRDETVSGYFQGNVSEDDAPPPSDGSR